MSAMPIPRSTRTREARSLRVSVGVRATVTSAARSCVGMGWQALAATLRRRWIGCRLLIRRSDWAQQLVRSHTFHAAVAVPACSNSGSEVTLPHGCQALVAEDQIGGLRARFPRPIVVPK